MASTYLSRTPASAGNRKTWTISFWTKISSISNAGNFLSAGNVESDEANITINSDGFLEYYDRTGGISPKDIYKKTNARFRDFSAWYHFVFAVDTTQATASDRVKIYVNGEEITSFSSSTNPILNYDSNFSNNVIHSIGRRNFGGTGFLDGSMSHIHFIDGTAYDATAFGEYDANGVWTIKTSPSVTYGTNGSFILKDGNSVTDQSGNSNNFTVGGGTLTNTEDNPSNVFATLNNLNKEIGGASLSLGNTKLVTTNGTPYTGKTNATLGASTGKYYWEVKPTSDVANTYPVCSIVGEDFNINNSSTYLSAGGTEGKSYITYKISLGDIVTNFTGTRVQTSYGNAVSTNDIVGVALDLDNGKVFFSINGTWQNSGDPVNGTNPASSNVGSLGGDIVFPAFGDENYTSSATIEVNFGNGYFGTTAVSSAGTNASGIGIFEYDVPTGYTALSTKGLNL